MLPSCFAPHREQKATSSATDAPQDEQAEDALDWFMIGSRGSNGEGAARLLEPLEVDVALVVAIQQASQ